jgi:beta-glucanase (GH16 family)
VGSAAAFYLEGCNTDKQELQFAQKPDWEQDFTKMREDYPLTNDWNFITGHNGGWGNKQQETYTPYSKNVRIDNGNLVLEAHHEESDHGALYTSARITTHTKHSFGYGKLEITAKLPAGIGTWPAIWMLSETEKYQPEQAGVTPHATGAWVLNGEIDIMEAVGSRPGSVYPALHTYNTVSKNTVLNPRPQIEAADSTDKFHSYGVERTPNGITFTYDGNPYYRVDKAGTLPAGKGDTAAQYWPFDQNYYLILNLAMGGTWGGELHDQYPPYGIDNSKKSWQLQIASIRHYPLANQG